MFTVKPTELPDFKPVTKQARFAMVAALTRTALEVRSGLYDEMRQTFDKPTPYTMNSLRVVPATMNKPEAVVQFKDYPWSAADHYLQAQIQGGKRQQKRSERLLRFRGYLGPDQAAVPANKADLDAYGNVKRGLLQRALSNLGAQFDKYSNTPARGTRQRDRSVREFFVMPGSDGRPVGIFQRNGKSARPFMFFVNTPTYRSVFDFYGVGGSIVERRYSTILGAAFAQYGQNK